MNAKELIAPFESNERTLLTKYFETYPVYAYEVTPPAQRKCYDATYRINPKEPSTMVEVKVRSFPIDKYPDYFLEMAKIMNLAKLSDQGHIIQYWNFFRNADTTYDLIIFNLNYRFALWRKQGPSIIEKRWMTYRTFENPNMKVEKDVVMIAFDPMLDFKYENTSWTL